MTRAMDATHSRLGQRHAHPPPASAMTPAEEATVERLLDDTRAFLGDVVTQKQGVLVHEVVLTLTQHPAVMPAVMGAMISAQRRVKDELLDAVAAQQRVQLTRLLQDVRSEQPSVVAQLISSCFQNRDGLVAWIADALHRRAAGLLVDAFHGYLLEERGNDCRSVFEQLLGVYMSALGMSSYPEELSQRIAELKHFLLPHNHTLDRHNATLRHQLVWGCHGIRNIGNAKSHIAGRLTPDEQLEICAAVSALARTLPLVAESLRVTEADQASSALPSRLFLDSPPAPPMKSPSPPPGLGTVSWSTGSMLSGTPIRASPPLPTSAPPLPPPLPPSPEPRISVEGYPPLPPASKREPVPSSPWSQSSTTSSSSSAVAQESATPTASQTKEVLETENSTQSSSYSTSSTASSSSDATQSSTSASTVVFSDPKRVYKMYYDRPDSLPPWSDAKVKMLYARMRNHMHQVPKANLCHYLRCHVPNCQKSHSYLECMSYNPIFKLLKCGNKDHFWGFEVNEVAECACAHVDLEISMEWMDRAKHQLCPHGARCSIRRCQKSHTVEEIKFYNPRFRTDRCQYQMRCVNKATCPYYHSEEDKRDIRLEDDYVGKPKKILFIERTHDALAKALDALRHQHAHA